MFEESVDVRTSIWSRPPPASVTGQLTAYHRTLNFFAFPRRSFASDRSAPSTRTQGRETKAKDTIRKGRTIHCVKNKGCAGLSYHLEYVEKPGKFDEIVEQDGVRVLIDSKALFSIIGSEMDWKEDPLSAKFAFRNPNIKDACGCGESFSINS
ncbi:hypothetical protein ONZ45_g2804 [Pleurotus djamor]|nr:hypothetical protein ONZ45_g2804 [Pleurotus djamor]